MSAVPEKRTYTLTATYMVTVTREYETSDTQTLEHTMDVVTGYRLMDMVAGYPLNTVECVRVVAEATPPSP